MVVYAFIKPPYKTKRCFPSWINYKPQILFCGHPQISPVSTTLLTLHRVTSLESVSFKSCLKQILQQVHGTSEPSSLSTQLLKITFWRSLFSPPKTSTWLIRWTNTQYFWSADTMHIHTAKPFSLLLQWII